MVEFLKFFLRVAIDNKVKNGQFPMLNGSGGLSDVSSFIAA